METVTLNHSSLHAKLKGVVLQTEPGIVQYRGIKYGEVPARFSRSTAVDSFGEAEVDCTQYGPRCPQLPYNLSALFRIPDSYKIRWNEPEDEFECLNLHITVPANAKVGDNLPVLVWIHGGSFVATVGSASTKTADPRRIVETSIKMEKPVIVVAINYRLNLFGFSYVGEGMANVGILDQRLALEWVGDHIEAFGGDKDNVTIFGESAGSISIHAHLQGSAKGLCKRAILMSGHMYSNPPQPIAAGESSVSRVCEHFKIEQTRNWVDKLREVPAEAIVRALEELNIHGAWLHDDGSFFDGKWSREYVPEWLDEIMLGDCEFESIVYNRNIQTLTAAEIVSLFNTPTSTPDSQRILETYKISPTDDLQARQGVLNFISDGKFSYYNGKLASLWRTAGKRVFQYIVDQQNPWDPVARSHHTVDLLLLFGGFELAEIDADARMEFEAVGEDMRRKWVSFANGIAPWNTEMVYAFGPRGECGELGEGEYGKRRRVEGGYGVMEELGWDALTPIVTVVTRGRINLDPGTLAKL